MPLVTHKPSRWDHPFGWEWDAEDLKRVLSVEPWREMAAEKKEKLEKLLRHESRLITRRRGEVIVREGDYGNSAFFVLRGSVRVILESGKLSQSQLGKAEVARRSLWSAFSQLWTNQREVEARADPGMMVSEASEGEEQHVPIILSDIDTVVERHGTELLGEGSLFGEIAALGRTPRTATLFADEDETELLEIRWQGLRDLRKAFAGFRTRVEELFRERAMRQHLRATAIFDRVGDSPGLRARIADGDIHGLFRETLGYRAPTESTLSIEVEGRVHELEFVAEIPDHGGRRRVAVLVAEPGLADSEERRQLAQSAYEQLGSQVILIHREGALKRSLWQWLLTERSEVTGPPVAMECLLRERGDPSELIERLIRPLCLDAMAQEAVFQSHGTFEWGRMGTQPVEEPRIATEGERPDGIIMVRCGFARVTRLVDGEERTVSYLGPGRAYGFEEIVNNWRVKGSAITLQRTLRALGYVDVVLLPTATIERYVLPTLREDELPPLVDPAPRRGVSPLDVLKDKSGTDRGLVEFIVDNRFTNGTAAMVIDLDRCTRCDDCVRGCADAHDGNPRFIRHGQVHDRLMIANACMHCADPVCMIGCPTGAISRESLGGEVVINDPTCIGCSTCANNCPYDNIRMVETRSPEGEMYTSEKGGPALKATKCDLCIDQLTGPACRNACPHDALERVDFDNMEEFAAWARR